MQFLVRPRGFTDNLKENELPPKDNDDYEYQVEDEHSNDQAPVGSRWMMHLYDEPADCGDSTICLDAFPKKKQERLAWKRTGKNVGWGIYFKEEPHKTWFAGLKFLVALASGLIFTVSWSATSHDKDKEFPWTVMGWVIAVVALGFDWIEAWLAAAQPSY